MMTSFRSRWSYIDLLTVCLFHLSSATIIPRFQNTTTTSFSLPVNANGSLPAPNANLTLLFTTIGVGTQNYTCNEPYNPAGPFGPPVFVGALATILNASSLASSQSGLNEATRCALYDPNSLNELQAIGHHYFAADGTPIFDLSAVGDILFGKKIASVNAPADADPGPDGTGAVPWIALVDKGGSVGLQAIYRVETAGGNPPAKCTSAGSLVVRYAAQYLFFV